MSEVKQCQGMYDECLNSSRIAELEAENAKLEADIDHNRYMVKVSELPYVCKLEDTIARLEAENTDLKWELAHYEAGGER